MSSGQSPEDAGDLFPVDPQVHPGQGVPSRGVQRTEPRMGKSRGCPERFPGRYYGQDGVARSFEGGFRGGVGSRRRFHRRRASLARRHDAVLQLGDDSGEGVVRDPQVVQGHPHRPVPAAVFQTGDSRDEDRFAPAIGRAGADQIGDGGPFLAEGRGETVRRTGAKAAGEEKPGHEAFREGETGPGRGEARGGRRRHDTANPAKTCN